MTRFLRSGLAGAAEASHARGSAVAVWLAILCGIGLVLNTAWISDDAYITLRTVDNFWHGYGLRWNVIERVQSYTHPLWMLVLGTVYGIIREPYATTIGVSLACTVGTLAVVTRIARSHAAAFTALVVLVSSRAFVEFSTSGLENPLSHLLLALFVWTYVQLSEAAPASPVAPRLALLSLLGGLCAVNRLETVWLTAPAIVATAWAVRPRRAALAALAGVAPPLAWQLFAVVYYGFALPNTAYAKLATGVPAGALAIQGGRYLLDSLLTDPITMPVIAIAIIAGIWTGRLRPISIGLIASLATVIAVGGDFMSGRFLSAPFLVAALMLCRVISLDSPRHAGVVAMAAILLSVSWPQSPLRVWRHPRATDPLSQRYGIVDERAIYYPVTGLVPVLMGASPADHSWARTGRSWSALPHVAVNEAVGLLGFYSGPAVHIIDPMGLTDPLLARLPAEPAWRIGHFKRSVPDGYVATLQRCLAVSFPHSRVMPPPVSCITSPEWRNVIRDPKTARLYDRLALVTQGPLLDSRRLRVLFE